MRKHYFDFGIALLALATASTRAHALTIVRDGAPQATIVIAAKAMTPAKDDTESQKISVAAHDLQDYLRKMSGATVPIAGDDAAPQGAAILVGRSRLTAGQDADIPHSLTFERKEEGFVIETNGNTLLLAGNDAGPYHGTEYATYDFLERLGVRWFMPGEFGEVVPSRRTIETGDLSVREKPDFIMRNWWTHMTPEMEVEDRRWKIRNKMNPDPMFDIPGDGSAHGFTASSDNLKTHPELFAKAADGSPDSDLPNLSNPQAITIAANKIKDTFRQHPDQNSIGLAPDDGMPRDYSPDTMKLNLNITEVGSREGDPAGVSMSEEWFHFINAVAHEVHQEFPDRIISTNGYANRDIAPQGMTMDPNLCIMFAAIWADSLHPYNDPKSWQAQRMAQMIRQWTKICPRVWLYGYTEAMMVSGETPVPLTRKLAYDIPHLKQWGLIGFFDESRNVWAESGITTKYVRARLEWDSNADVNALLNDFFTKWYGAAARPSRAFWDHIEDCIQNSPILGHEDRVLPYVYTPQLLTQLEADLEQSERLAATDRDRLHVHVDRLIYEHLKAYMAMSNAEFAGNFAEAARQADHMMEIRQPLYNINHFLIWHNEVGYESGAGYWGITPRADFYRKYAALTDGTKGDLVAILPERAAFRTDPFNEGMFAEWYAPDWNTRDWQSVLTTKPFYAQGYMNAQGYPYTGYLWYRVNVDVPASARGRRVILFAPAVETEAWGWVNGKFVGHRPFKESYERPNELEFDVTDAIVPGRRNTIALRVNTSLSYDVVAGGLVSRLVLYSPKP